MIYKKYFVREDFELSKNIDNEKLMDALDKAINDKPYQNESIEHFLGNYACGPYVLVTCDSPIAAEVFQHAILDVFYKLGIKRR